jgi:hypothetical protein
MRDGPCDTLSRELDLAIRIRKTHPLVDWSQESGKAWWVFDVPDHRLTYLKLKKRLTLELAGDLSFST